MSLLVLTHSLHVTFFYLYVYLRARSPNLLRGGGLLGCEAGRGKDSNPQHCEWKLALLTTELMEGGRGIVIEVI